MTHIIVDKGTDNAKPRSICYIARHIYLDQVQLFRVTMQTILLSIE